MSSSLDREESGVKETLLGSTPKVNYFADVIRLSSAFFMIFVAYNTSQALATSLINKTLADVSLAALYAAFAAVAIPAPKVVDRIGPSVSMIIGGLAYPLLVLTFLHPAWYTTLPASIIAGIGASLLWTGQGVYLGRVANRAAIQSGEPIEAVTSRFNGVFFAAFQFNGFLGTTVSSIVFLAVSNFDSAEKFLFIALTAAASLGIAIIFTMRRQKPLSEDKISTEKSITSVTDDADKKEHVSFMETLQLCLRSRAMQCVLPLVLYNGMSLGFFFSDFSAEVSKVVLGKDYVGFTVATFYLVNSIASWGMGKVAGTGFGRRGIITVAFISAILFFGLMFGVAAGLSNDSITHRSGLAFVIAFGLPVVFAVGDAVFESQPPAILQSPTFFPSEKDRDAAMSNVKLWQSVGFAIQFALGFLLKELWIKLLILTVICVISAVLMYYMHTRVMSLDTDDSEEASKRSGSGIVDADAAAGDEP